MGEQAGGALAMMDDAWWGAGVIVGKGVNSFGYLGALHAAARVPRRGTDAAAEITPVRSLVAGSGPIVEGFG